MSENDLSKQKLLAEALAYLQSAIDLLDRAAAPGQIAAHVDLAANQLEELLAPPSFARFTQMNENGEGFGTVQPF